MKKTRSTGAVATAPPTGFDQHQVQRGTGLAMDAEESRPAVDERLEQLERELAARDRKIDDLMDRLDERLVTTGSATGVLEQNVAAEKVTEDETRQTESLNRELIGSAARREIVFRLLSSALRPLPVEELVQSMLAQLLASDQLSCLSSGRVSVMESTSSRLVAEHVGDESGAAVCPDTGKTRSGKRTAWPTDSDRHECCVPIRSRDEVIGVLTLCLVPGRQLGLEEQRILHAASDVFAGVLHREGALREADRRERETHQRLDRVLEASRISTWDWNMRTGEVAFDRTWSQRLGYAANEIPPTVAGWTTLVHPDDRGRAHEMMLAVLRGELAEPELEYRIRNRSGDWRWFEVRGSILERDDAGRAIRAAGTHLDITERREGADRARRLATAVEQATETIVVTDLDGRIEYANPAFERITGYTREEAIGRTPSVLQSGKHDRAFYDELWSTVLGGHVWSGHFFNRRKDGTLYEEEATISPIRDDHGEVTHFVAVKRDVTEQLGLQRQLGQAQKLEAVGQLAAGIAHEINTPIQYVGDNLRFLEGAFGDLLAPIRSLMAIVEASTDGAVDAERLDKASAALDKADVDYLEEEIPRAVTQSLDGVENVRRIVHAMKRFSHPGSEDKAPCDLNESIRNATTVSRNEWKYVAELELELDDRLPLVPCLIGPINQVILNLIVNAAHAIEAAVDREQEQTGTIAIATSVEDGWARILVRDTGCGIEPKNLEKIFEPFFTTKTVGKGTGQGLSIAHSVIVGQHAGRLDVESTLGEGSTFTIRLPIENVEAPEREDGDSS